MEEALLSLAITISKTVDPQPRPWVMKNCLQLSTSCSLLHSKSWQPINWQTLPMWHRILKIFSRVSTSLKIHLMNLTENCLVTKNLWGNLSSTMSTFTVVVPLTLQASRFLFLRVALWNYYSFGEENSRNSMSQVLEHNASQPHYQQ